MPHISQKHSITSSTSNLLITDLLLVLVTLLAAISWMFSKEALAEFTPLLFMAVRFFLSGIILLIPGINQTSRLSINEVRQSSIVGIVFGCAMSLWILGLSTAQYLGEASFLTSLAIPIVPVFAWLLYRDSITTDHLWALPISAIGLALLSVPNGFNLETNQLFFIAAAFLLAWTFVLNSRAASSLPALPLSAIQLLWVGIIAGILSLAFESWPQQWTHTMTLWLILSIFIGTALRFYLQTIAQGRASAAHTAIILLIEPIWTALFAALWFGERMQGIQYLGCGVIFLALLASRRRLLLKLLR